MKLLKFNFTLYKNLFAIIAFQIAINEEISFYICHLRTFSLLLFSFRPNSSSAILIFKIEYEFLIHFISSLLNSSMNISIDNSFYGFRVNYLADLFALFTLEKTKRELQFEI